jgi:uncharacterized membrane protein
VSRPRASRWTAEPHAASRGAGWFRTADRRRRQRLAGWRRDALRTTFWLVPSLLVIVAALLFTVTLQLDWAAYQRHLSFPAWIADVSTGAAVQVLVAIAAAVITVVGVVFSVTIVALTLASQQFGPRMMRNFVRDAGNQLTLGVFVATFVYAMLTLVATTSDSRLGFVPHLSVAVTEVAVLVDLGVLIYFIHHISRSIQLPEVIAGIARDLLAAIDAEFPVGARTCEAPAEFRGRSARELVALLDERGEQVPAHSSGYLQFVGHAQLVRIASKLDAVIRLEHRAGHFLVAGHPVATVWPRGAAAQIEDALAHAHITGPHRTLTQDPVFAIDQLVEIAIRALSPAVNDTFTALTCIDWLSAGLAAVSGRTLARDVYRDAEGRVRLIERDVSYASMVNRAFDKVRQAASGMPAVIIRMLDALALIGSATTSQEQREALRRQGEAIWRGAQASVTEQNDLGDIEASHRRLVGAHVPDRSAGGGATRGRAAQERARRRADRSARPVRRTAGRLRRERLVPRAARGAAAEAGWREGGRQRCLRGRQADLRNCPRPGASPAPSAGDLVTTTGRLVHGPGCRSPRKFAQVLALETLSRRSPRSGRPRRGSWPRSRS